MIEEETCELNNQLLPSTSALVSTTQEGDIYPEAEKIFDDMSKPIVNLQKITCLIKKLTSFEYSHLCIRRAPSGSFQTGLPSEIVLMLLEIIVKYIMAIGVLHTIVVMLNKL